MDKIKNLIIMICGVGLLFFIIYLINFISVGYFEYSIPFWLNFLFIYWGGQILNKAPLFRDSKIVLFEKNEKE
tara:strand:- start:343 stop:561 length:219 start_codon:yes stop_codon:yes gene_type:complete